MALSKSAAVATTALRRDEPFTIDELERETLRELDVDVGRRTVKRVVGELVDEAILERVDRGGPYPAEYHLTDQEPRETAHATTDEAARDAGAVGGGQDRAARDAAHSGHSATHVESGDVLVATDGGAVPIDELEREQLVDALEAFADRALDEEPRDVEIGHTKVGTAGKLHLSKNRVGEQYDRLGIADGLYLYRRDPDDPDDQDE